MKYLLILFSLCAYSQSLVVPNDVNIYLENWKIESDKRNIPAFSRLVKNIDTIKFKPLPFPQLGRTDNWTRTIELNSFIRVDSLIFRTVLYHELFHGVVWNGEHSCSFCLEIMAEYGPPTYAIWLDDKNWQKSLDKYFIQMENYLKN